LTLTLAPLAHHCVPTSPPSLSLASALRTHTRSPPMQRPFHMLSHKRTCIKTNLTRRGTTTVPPQVAAHTKHTETRAGTRTPLWLSTELAIRLAATDRCTAAPLHRCADLHPKQRSSAPPGARAAPSTQAARQARCPTARCLTCHQPNSMPAAAPCRRKLRLHAQLQAQGHMHVLLR